MRAAKLFTALARFGGLAFEAIARLALAPSPGICLLTAAIVLLRRARVDQSASARFALLGGQRGQDDDGLGWRRRHRLRGREGRGRRRGGKRRLGSGRSNGRWRGGGRRRRRPLGGGRFSRRQ